MSQTENVAMEDRKIRNPLTSLVIFICTAIFDGVKYTVRKIIIFATFIGIIYLSSQIVFQYNPSLKAQFDEKRTMVASLLGQAESMMDQLEKINGNSINPASISSDVGIIAEGASSQQNVLPPLDNTQNIMKSQIISKVTPKQLQPFLDALNGSKNYQKYLNMLTIDKVGHNGSGAISILEKALKTNNQELRNAALNSLYRIGTNEALSIARGYGK